MSIFPDEIQNKAKQKTEDSSESDWLKMKKNGQIIHGKDNPVIGRLVAYDYVEADDYRYGNEEGKKHVLTWKVRDDKGSIETKKQSTTSWRFVNKLIQYQKEFDTKDFKFWLEQIDKNTSVWQVEAYSGEEEEEEEEEEPEVDEVQMEDIPF